MKREVLVVVVVVVVVLGVKTLEESNRGVWKDSD